MRLLRQTRFHLPLLAMLLAPIAPALAHPHVWVTAKAALEFDDSGKVAAVNHRWTFDKAFSAYATQGLDRNGDGAVTPDELSSLAKENIDGLTEFSWFTQLKINGAKTPFIPPTGGAMELVDGQLVLNFRLPLQEAAAPGKALMLDISDPSYFVAFTIAEGDGAVTLDKGPAGCVTNISRPKAPPPPTENLTEDFFNALSPAANYGSQFANKVVVACP